MNTITKRLRVSTVFLAVQSALAAVPLLALAQEEDDIDKLIYPENFLEIGGLYLSDDSPKFGEYNGLNESGGYLLGNFEMRGGDGYGMGNGTKRWEIFGNDLGSNSREIGASYADQGKWRLSVGYDTMRHYTTQGYQTPFQGSMGENTFILPSDFGVINTTTTTTSGVITSDSKGTRTLTDHQLSYFHNEEVYSERQNAHVKAGYDLDPQWNLRFEFNRLDQSGAKLIGSGTDAYDLTGSGGFRYGGERVAILMNPTNYKTDTFNLALNWAGKQAYATVAYAGSIFHDDYRGVSWSNPFVTGGSGALPDPATGTSPGDPFPISTMSTPPSNEFHQLNLTGGYLFSPTTKLSGGLSYGRNTQDEGFAGTYTTTPDTMPGLPVNSLDGLVIISHADVKLTHRANQALTLNASARYDERDNRTDAHTFTFLDLGGDPQTVVNIPMSNRRINLDLGGDYRIDPRQRVHLGYEYDRIKRWCNESLSNNAQGQLSAANAGYYTTASCVQVPENREHKLVLGYKLRAGEGVNLTAGYDYSRRKADINDSFYNPMQENNQGFENYGFLAYFDDSRKEHLFKAGVTWQATDRFNLGLNGRYRNDDYDSTLGVQKGKATSLNLDASYLYSENNTVSAFVSMQRRTRDLLSANDRNAVAPPVNLWSNELTDKDTTFGISGKQKGLWAGKLQLAEDLTYSLSKSGYSTDVQYTLTGNAAIGNLSYGSLPDIESKLLQLKLTGTYQLDKASDVVMGYQYQRLISNDYYYNAYQYGYTPTTLIPTNQDDPSYTDNAVFVAYHYKF